MARPAALGPMKQAAARQMRNTANTLDADHPETVAGSHVRDAARLTERGATDGAKRHLDAAMQLMTPQSLTRHGIRDDEGHATAKHHLHLVHRHLLHVQDIEDARDRNEEIRTALRAARGQVAATDVQAAASPPLPGHAPPARQQPGGPAVGLAVDLAKPGQRFYHGWIPVAGASQLHGKVVVGRTRKGTVIGTYDHQAGTVRPRGLGGPMKVEHVRRPGATEPAPGPFPPRGGRLRRLMQTAPGFAGDHGNPVIDMSARTPMLERTPAPRGRPGGPGLYRVKGMGHTPYLQQVVKALIEKRGMSSDKAYAIARARIRKWMATSRHPEVRAAATRAEAGELARQARAHSHAIGPWEVADTLIELACEPIDLMNPYHSATGQFTTAQGAQQKQQGKQQQAKQAAKREGRHDARQRAVLTRRIAGLRSQIAALQAQLPSGRKSRSSTPAKRGAAATSAKQAAQAKQTATKAGASARKPAKAGMSPATIRSKIIALRAELRADLAELRSL